MKQQAKQHDARTLLERLQALEAEVAQIQKDQALLSAKIVLLDIRIREAENCRRLDSQ